MHNDDDFEWFPPQVINHSNSGSKRRRKMSREDILKRKVQDATELSPEARDEALIKLDSSDVDKGCEWVESLLKIPFGKYCKLPVTHKSSDVSLKKFFRRTTETLDKAVHGMKTVKEEVLNYIAQFITSGSNTSPRVLGLCGSPGIGKTAIIRKGFAEALNRPLVSLSMGGIRDSNYFVGHDYTYVGSKCGIIVKNLMTLGCMNGIMFMDEVDKISNSHDGVEIQNLLLHITDPVQNHTFHDKYFAGIDIDLSNIVFVFSYNDESLIDPILRDRIYTIRVPDPSLEEKIQIGKHYLFKEIMDNINIPHENIDIHTDVFKYILTHYCRRHKGVRQLKKCIESLVLKINTAKFTSGTPINRYKCFKQNLKFPFVVTTSVVDELLEDMKDPTDLILSHMFM